MARNMTGVALLAVLVACNGNDEKPASTNVEPTVDLTRPLPEGLSEEEPGPLDTGDTDAAEDTEPPGDTEPPDDTNVPGPSYATTVAPIIAAHCDGCHLNGGASGGVSFDAGATAMVNVAANGLGTMDLIEPGQPAQSYLWLKINGLQDGAGGVGSQMPLAGDPLSAGELATIEAWINGGALP